MRRRTSPKLVAPFFSPNAFQARLIERAVQCSKPPLPAIALCGLREEGSYFGRRAVLGDEHGRGVVSAISALRRIIRREGRVCESGSLGGPAREP